MNVKTILSALSLFFYTLKNSDQLAAKQEQAITPVAKILHPFLFLYKYNNDGDVACR